MIGSDNQQAFVPNLGLYQSIQETADKVINVTNLKPVAKLIAMNRRSVIQPVLSQTANGTGRMILISRFVRVLLARGKKNPGCVRQFDMQKGKARAIRRLDTV